MTNDCGSGIVVRQTLTALQHRHQKAIVLPTVSKHLHTQTCSNISKFLHHTYQDRRSGPSSLGSMFTGASVKDASED